MQHNYATVYAFVDNAHDDEEEEDFLSSPKFLYEKN